MNTQKLKASWLKTMAAAFAAALTSAAAFGQPSWATVNTAAYEMDDNPSQSQTLTGVYSGYLCTVDTAKKKFGSDAIDGVTAYFVNHFSSGSSTLASLSAEGTSGAKLSSGATALDSIEWGDGQYSFTTYFAAGADGNLVAGGDYLGILLYESGDDKAVRVFSATATDALTWTADDSVERSAGAMGAWTPVTEQVPEPTSGLLLAFGLAGLALRRKRA